MRSFPLPPSIAGLIAARNAVRDHYRQRLADRNATASLHFTLDGNLIGDLGEALAVDLFGIRLVNTKSMAGIDGYAPDGVTTVQVKATGTGRGPAFRQTETKADHLLFFELDMERSEGTIVFNGPEHYATRMLPVQFSSQRSLTRNQIRFADAQVPEQERLLRLAV